MIDTDGRGNNASEEDYADAPPTGHLLSDDAVDAMNAEVDAELSKWCIA